MRGAPLAYVVWHQVKVAHINPGSCTYLNLDKEMIARTPIFVTKSNLRLNKDSLYRVYVDYQTDAFKVDNAMVYQMLTEMFTDTDAFVYVKQRKSIQDGQAVFFDIHKHFLSIDHVAKQATDAEG